MRVEQAALLPKTNAELRELTRILARYRWQLGLERSLAFAIRGVVAAGVASIALSVAAWFTGNAQARAEWLAVAPIIAALLIAIVRWPSSRQAAITADRRLALDERLATAVELTRAPPRGRFDHLQLRDAIAHAESMPSTWLASRFSARMQNEAVLGALVLLLAVASLLLSALPRPGFVSDDPAASPSEVAALPDMAARALPEDAPDVALANAQPIEQPQSNTGLGARVQQEQAERSALDTLSHALSSVSAGQPASDAIQQSDFAAARDQLQSLGDQADQLSDAAKQQLAKSLQQAATATAANDRQLADKERQAAQALARNSYADQRQALRSLADQVERSGAKSVGADQLQRDVGRLQQLGGGAQAASSQSSSGQSASASAPASSASAGQGDQPATVGAGVGTGADPNVYGAPSALNTAGQTVSVPMKLGAGPAPRPSDGTEDQTGVDPSLSGQTISELSRSQQTGQVAPEQNLVPGEQRPIVRGYFR